jgi:hypothetical protein
MTGNARLCVLGAGNCNDIDLARLERIFEEIVLVDLDREALETGRSRQRLDVADRLKCLGEIDVTGCLSRTATWSAESQLGEPDLVALATGADIRQWPIVPYFDVVASTCLLSQLIGSLDHSLTSRHPHFVDAVQSVRSGHFRTVAALLKPGGRMVFFSDVVSSDTCPELLQSSEVDRVASTSLVAGLSLIGPMTRPIPRQLETESNVHRIVSHAIKSGNFFTGLNPVVIHKLLKSDPEIAPLFADVAFIAPWRWQCGRRTYAVYAITAKRTAIQLP